MDGLNPYVSKEWEMVINATYDTHRRQLYTPPSIHPSLPPNMNPLQTVCWSFFGNFLSDTDLVLHNTQRVTFAARSASWFPSPKCRDSAVHLGVEGEEIPSDAMIAG
jgi:hypothetical protein